MICKSVFGVFALFFVLKCYVSGLAEQNQKCAELERKYASLSQNMSDLRTEMLSSTYDLQLYLSQEISTRRHLEDRVDEMIRNYTLLQNRFEMATNELENLKAVVKGNLTNFQQNLTVMKMLYEDDLQQTYALRSSQASLQQAVKELSLVLVDTNNEVTYLNQTLSTDLMDLRLSVADDLKKLNKSLKSEFHDVWTNISQTRNILGLLWANTSHLGTDLEQLKQTVRSNATDVAASIQHLRTHTSTLRTDIEKLKQEDAVVSFHVATSVSGPRSDGVLRYNQVTTNVGQGYNSWTGIFTAPIAGTYIFMWSAYSATLRKECSLYLYRNNVKYNIVAFSYSHDTTELELPASAAISLMKGDRVWIHSTSCSYLTSFPNNYFVGFKL